MSRLSMSELTTYRWSFEEDVAHYRAAGFEAIGVWRQKLSDYGEDKGVELLSETGLSVSNLLWAGGFTGCDGRSLRESIDDASEAIRLAADLRADCLVIYSGARAGHTHSHARRLLREALKELLPQATTVGVTLAVEPMHPEFAVEWTFLTSLDESLELLQAINHPRLKLAFDTYHLGLSPDIVQRLPELAGKIGIVHLGDGHPPLNREQNRTPLGHGAVPLKELVAALTANGYDGYYDVELIGADIEAADYHQLLAQTVDQCAGLFETVGRVEP